MANPRATKIAELKARIESAKAEIAQLQAEEQTEKANLELGKARNFAAAAADTDAKMEDGEHGSGMDLTGQNKSSGLELEGNRNDQGDFIEAQLPQPTREMNKDEKSLYDAVMADPYVGLTDEQQLTANGMSDQDFIDTGIPAVERKTFPIDDTLDNDEPPTGEKGTGMNLSGVKIEEKEDEVKPKLSDVTDAQPMNLSGIDLSEDDDVEDEIVGSVGLPEYGESDTHVMEDGKVMKDEDMPEEGGRSKPTEIENKRGEKAGWEMGENSNTWSVNEKDPYWKTEEGYDEAVDLYGKKPSWLKDQDVGTLVYNPSTGEYEEVEPEEFEDLSRPSISADIKKLFG